jgi:D-psicose/D-tagatose/L-ribulose 3-epimerase
MKLGINTWVWVSPFTTRSLDLLDRIAGMGFDLVEVAVEDVGAIDVPALKRKLAETGLGVTLCGAFGPSRDISDLDPALRAGGRTYMEDCIRMAEQLDCRIFAGPVYSAVGKTRLVPAGQKEQEWAHCVANLKALAPMARDAGVTICIEPLNRFETDMINLAEQARKLIADVGSPAYKVHLDSFHGNIEEKSVPAAIRAVGKGNLGHFHSCENDRSAPGTGHQDWTGIRDALREIEYEGAAVIESFTPATVEIAKAASIWRPLAATQDDLAKDGLRFLRQLFS